MPTMQTVETARDPSESCETVQAVFEEVPVEKNGIRLHKLYRTKTPEGWLVAVDGTRSIAFVPDHRHEWLKAPTPEPVAQIEQTDFTKPEVSA